MKRISRLLLLVLSVSFFFSCNKRSGEPRVLIFTRTADFVHDNIPAAKVAFMKLFSENKILADTTSDPSYFNEDSLKNYSAVVFLNTTGNVLDNHQEAAFERYIQAGGGFMGIHAATDTEYDWGWYGRLVGAYFNGHPEQQEAVIRVVDKDHESTKHLPTEWKRKDEWYNFKKINPDIKVLLTIDESTYKGGTNGENHPMAWYHEFDGGRSFYTELGHVVESFSDENYLKHILGGIKYAIGDNEELDFGKAKTAYPPEDDRFTKTMLTEGTLFEPTEMTILPNFDVLIAQRRGELMLFKKSDSSVKQVGYLDVYWKTNTPGVNAEEGFLGLQADPDFAKNNFVYIFYSPIDTSVNRLSRFVFKNDSLDKSSEKVILQFYSQREICCHTGGSIAFGPDRTLYLSTGDNSTPFDQPNTPYQNHGYGPNDRRPGLEQYDAGRTSGNSNDLRGKILRIKINEDGTYDIPEGNLFAKGQAKTRPEIFVMGNRNPYRISVDKKTGTLYWGEVGPDAPNDSMNTRGPRGYDEVNRAAKAGFYGWPFLVGNNFAYRDYDYSTGTTHDFYSAQKPQNTSKNNTGIVDLPAAQPAYIWYPYSNSVDFPQVGTGGRNAMAGPVYYADMYPKETRLPDYYNNKLFVYDWIRGWVKIVTMNEDGSLDRLEPVWSSTKFNNPIDMEMGPDGKIYVLEYGSGWFSKNPDAGLARMDYNPGNRAPKVGKITIDKTSGALPLAVELKVDAKDPENKNMTYKWNLGKQVVETKEPILKHTFQQAGKYTITVDVVDEEKLSARSNSVLLYAGNEAPTVSLNILGNKSFYLPGKPVSYEVTVNDKEDGSVLNSENLFVSADYQEGSDRAATVGHQQLSEAMTGKNLMESLDCKSCHKLDEKSIGPSYTDVAKKYSKDNNASEYLVNKIIRGGSGVWGEVAMPAHADLGRSDAQLIVTYIRSLAKEDKKEASLPAKGSVPATLGMPAKRNGVLVISATYTDKGGNNSEPLSGFASAVLKSNVVNLRSVDNMNGFSASRQEGQTVLTTPVGKGYFSIDSVDLTDVSSITFQIGIEEALVAGYKFMIHLDSENGSMIGQFQVPADKWVEKKVLPINVGINKITDGKMHNIYIMCTPIDPKETKPVKIRSVEFK